MKFWPFFLFGSTLFATVNEPLRWEFFSGYRNDRIHWHLQNPGEGGATYRELYRDVQYWENGLTLKVVHRDLSFFLRGAYGAFGRGDLSQNYVHSPIIVDQPRFQFNTDGWTAEGSGYFGYAINLTADRTYKVILTPLIGYGGYFERLTRKDGTPDPFISKTIEGALSTFKSTLQGDYRLAWYGFLFGGGFTFQPGGSMILNAGYSFHLLRVRQHSPFQDLIALGSPPISEAKLNSSLTVKEGGNRGHSGWVQMDYILSCYWRLGLGAQIHYFFTRVLDAKIHTNLEVILPTPAAIEQVTSKSYKLRWTAISGWFQVSREF